MGKFEKLVVLTVLFAAAVVLAVSFTRDRPEVEAADPLSGSDEMLDRNNPALGLENAGGGEVGEESPAPSLLLNAGGESEFAPAGLRPALPAPEPEPALSLEPESDPSHRILFDTTGLRPSFVDEYMQYTALEGDTWSSLAQRFYQDGRFTRNLRLANEDLDELGPGKQILVPVFDFLALDENADGTAQPAAATPASADSVPARSVESAAPRAVEPATSQKTLEYEVRSGDTLSDISMAVFGTATRWKEILEANRDKLQKPESLQVGMKLKIPEGGKLPASTGKGEATKPAPKSNAKTNASTSSTKSASKPAAPAARGTETGTKKKKVD